MITCLLIDDDLDDHDFFRIALEQINPEISSHFVENGLSGLKLLPTLKQRSKVIFLDLNMPVMGGLEFLSELLKTNYQDIPVTVYSTSDERFFKQKALEHGAVAYLTKTSTMNALVEGIGNELKNLSLL
ncbi:hypothetical protein CNR22_15990 [Sphingobacteriaceae bacterium]|nr:hypothetical protein CNR22_15990 [Sphingobacteriaceae bacterium]